MTSLAAPAKLDIGRVVSRTFSAIGANFVNFSVITLIFSAIPGWLIGFAWSSYALPLVINGEMSAVTYGLLSYPVNFLAAIPGYVAMGAVTHGAMVTFNGARASLGDCIGTGIARALPLLLLGIVTGFAVVIGFIVFIIPGIFAALVLYVSAPAMVVEKLGLGDAMKRSSDLTKDNRWRIFWLLVIVGVVTMLIGMLLGFVLVATGGGQTFQSMNSLGTGTWTDAAVTIIADTLGSLIGLTGVASVYYELRTNKEGATSDELAKVFD